MKNIITSNYKQQYSPFEIQKFISRFKKELSKQLEDKLTIYEVETPLYSTKKVSSEIYEIINSRLISFGTATDNEIYYLYNNYDYWFRNELLNLEIKSNSGIYSFLKYVKRDVNDSNHSTLRKDEIHIELRYDGSKKEEKMLDLIKLVNQSIEKSISRTFDNLNMENNYKYNVMYFDLLNDGLDKNDSINQIDALTEKHGIVSISNININKKREIYSIDEYPYIITTAWSFLTKDAHSIIRIGYRKTYPRILLSIKEEKLDSKDEIFFSKEILEKNVPNSIYIKIDLNRIIMNVLKLAHIGECISDVQSEDIEKLKKKGNIKKL